MRRRICRGAGDRLAGACVAAISLSWLGHSADATPYDWVGASNTAWNAGWTGGNVPTVADDLTILGPLNTAGALTINVQANAFARTINFTDPAVVVLANSSGANTTLTLQSGLTTGAGAVTIGSTTVNQGVLVALGANQAWTVGAGGLTVNNTISGTSFGITKSGSGTLTLNSSNTYGGTTVINAGTIVANGDTTGVLAAGKAFTLAGGAFEYRSTNGSVNAQTIGAVAVTTGGNTIQSTETGAGSSTLTVGTITRTVGATVNLVTSGVGAAINSTPAMSVNTGAFYNGDYAVAAANSAVGAVVYGTTANTANVSGTLAPTIGNYYNLTGNTSVTGNLGGGTIRFGGNYTLTVTGTTSVSGFLTNGSNGLITGSNIRASAETVFATNGSSDTLTVSSPVTIFNNTGSSQVVKSGAGKLVFTGNNTYFGNTNVNQGTLQSTSANGLGYGGVMNATNLGTGKTIVAAGATLDLAPATAMTVNEAITLNGGALINSGTGTTTLDSGIATINLTNLGSGGTANTGTVTISGTGSGAAATIVVVSGSVTSFTPGNAGTGYTGTPTVTFNIAGQTTPAAATATLSSLTLNGVNTLGGVGNLVVNAVVADGTSAGGFSKIGAGKVTLTGLNTYTGPTTVSEGVLLVSGSITGSSGTTVSNAGSTLGGTGTVGAVTVGGGAILQGGDGVAASGALSSGGDVNLTDNSIIKLTLGTGNTHSSLARTGGA